MDSLTPSQQALVEQHHNLIYYYLHKHSFNVDDFYDMAAIGLCKAAIAFDTSRGVPFASFACAAMRNEILRELALRNRDSKLCTVSLDALFESDGDVVPGYQLLPAGGDAYADCITHSCLMDRLPTFTDGELRSLHAYLLCDNYQHAADILGISKQRVYQHMLRIRDKVLGNIPSRRFESTSERDQLMQAISALVKHY